MSLIKRKLANKQQTTKPSFVSYIPAANSEQKEKSDDEKSLDELSVNTAVDDERMSQLSAGLLEFSQIISDDMFKALQPSYLPGEVMISSADRVMRYVPYSDCHQAVIGTMFVTNFRIIFMPVQSPDLTQMGTTFLRNKLYDESDVILNNIWAAYQVSKSKRKKLITGKQGNRTIKKIEFHCKDFRLHQFGFEYASKEETTRVTNAIAYFAFPDKLDRQFAFAYSGNTEPNSPLPDFSTKQSWEAELKRLVQTKLFQVTDFNENFVDSLSMPKYFVVPSSLKNDSLRHNALKYEEYTVPVWSYTYKTGASLIRMTFLLDTCPYPEVVEREFEEKLKQIHPEKKMPVVIDVHDTVMVISGHREERIRLPSIKEVKGSQDKLREMCIPVKMKALESTDSSWHSGLESTKWLTHVGSCLKVAVYICQLMTGKSELHTQKLRASVIIKEHDGARDIAAVLSSLVQLLLDPYYRSIQGFQVLVEKEWVALGHHFRDRCAIIKTAEDDDKESPVFLLFLDCVYQLQRLLPKSFEFSEYYLTWLWDSVCSGLFGNFLFNSQREMMNEISPVNNRFCRLDDKSRCTINLLNVWDMNKQYSTSDLMVFRNPAYVQRKVKVATKPSLDGFAAGNHGCQTKQSVRILTKYRYYTDKPNHTVITVDPDDPDEKHPSDEKVELCPDISWTDLTFWSGCFLRWLTPVQIVGGGTPVTFVLESMLTEHIARLLNEIQTLECELYPRQSRDNPDFTPYWSTKPRSLTNITSSFPYQPPRPMAGMYFFGMPMTFCPEELVSSSEFQNSGSSTDTRNDS